MTAKELNEKHLVLYAPRQCEVVIDGQKYMCRMAYAEDTYIDYRIYDKDGHCLILTKEEENQVESSSELKSFTDEVDAFNKDVCQYCEENNKDINQFYYQLRAYADTIVDVEPFIESLSSWRFFSNSNKTNV